MKNQDCNARSADATRGTLEIAGPCRSADSARGGRPQGAMVQNGAGSPFKPVRDATCEMACRAAILKPPDIHQIASVADHRNGTRSSSMVGMNSETVG